MILSVELHNFLSHKHSIVSFCENNNTFVGQTDSGKSSFLKGIKWCRWNRPLGDEFYSWPEVRDNGDKDMWVKITMDNHVVTRKKGKEEEYILDGMSFKAFGTNVPQEIADAFNFSEINLQNQLDSHFLLSDTPGNVATFFNSVAHLQSIDKGTSAINSAIRELTSDIKFKEQQEIKLNSELDTYAHISIFESEVESLEKLDKELAVLESDKGKLMNIAVNYRLNAISIEKQSKILAFEKPVDKILADIELRAKMDLEEVRLDKLINQIYKNQVDIDEFNELLKAETPVLNLLQLYLDKKIAVDTKNRLFQTISNIRGIQDKVKKHDALIRQESTLSDILELIDKRKKAEEEKMLFSKLIENIKTIQTRIEKGELWIKTNESLFEKEMGNVCVLCGSKLKHQHV